MLSWLFGAGGPTREVLMYTRKGCHLCDDAWALLQRAAKRYRLSLAQRDVDDDPALAAEYGTCVPVVLIDGKVRFRGVINEVLLERVLRHEPEEENRTTESQRTQREENTEKTEG
jgi:glutaredoxin